MSDLTNQIIEGKQQLARQVVETTIEKYKDTLNNVIFSETVKKNVEELHKRIDKIEDYLKRSAEFSWSNFALELGLSFASSLIVSYGLKKFILKKDSLQGFKREDLYVKRNLVGDKWLVFSLDPRDQAKHFALISRKNFEVMAKKHDNLVDFAYSSVKENIFSDAAYDAFMGLLFATSQGLIQAGLTETQQKSKSRFISLEELKTTFKNDLLKYWDGIYNSIETSTEYVVLNNFIDGLQKYNSNWDRGKILENEFKSQLNKMLEKYFEYAIYVGLGGIIKGKWLWDGAGYLFNPKIKQNLFAAMEETGHLKGFQLKHLAKLVGERVGAYLESSTDLGQVKGQIKYEYVLCKVTDLGPDYYVLAILITKYKVGSSPWYDFPMNFSLGNYFGVNTKFIAVKKYVLDPFIIDIKEFINNDDNLKNFTGDLIFNYMFSKTKKLLGIIPSFKSTDDFVDISQIKKMSINVPKFFSSKNN